MDAFSLSTDIIKQLGCQFKKIIVMETRECSQ
jgi:hypothetical protein